MHTGDELFVVGIAASAGGIPPMIELLEHASCHKSMCFVIVSHVSRYSPTDLARILSRASNLDAVEIEEGMGMEHCKVYTIPPDRYVEISEGKFHLLPRPKGQPNQCADHFFSSLAQSYGPNAIGVVLSGGLVGSDGAQGVVEIKKRNGHTYAQDPATADYPDMPEQAIGTGHVDSVLSPLAMGNELSLVSWAL